MKLKDLPLLEQPREKLLRYGPERLSLVELLAIILGTGQKGEHVIELSERILKTIELNTIINKSAVDIKDKIGLGISKCCTIVACLEFGKRLLDGKKFQLILKPSDVWMQLSDICEKRKEHFVVFYLDIRNQIIKKEIISIGTLNASLVHPREVYELAIRDGAAQIILSHNHPSDIVEPSQEDIEITHRLISSGKILGIEVVDHIIVSKSGYFSFKEKNLI